MADPTLYRIAQEYAELFNRTDPAVIEELISEACIEPNWDDRTNLLSLRATSARDLGLVLATEPGGEDYLVVRFMREWVVDDTPVDWDELEQELFERPRGSWAGGEGSSAWRRQDEEF